MLATLLAATGLVVGLFALEIGSWPAALAKMISRFSAKRLPAQYRDKYSEMYLSDLEELPGGITKLLFSLRVLARTSALNRELRRDQMSGGGTKVAEEEYASFARYRHRLAIVLGLTATIVPAIFVLLTVSYISVDFARVLLLTITPSLLGVVFASLGYLVGRHGRRQNRDIKDPSNDAPEDVQ